MLETRGALDEYSLTVGLNLNHKLYFGASLGIQDLEYKETTQLFEQDVNNKIPYFDDLEFRTHLNTTGTGYNGRVGVIFKPNNSVRLGASICTPTFFRMHDTFETAMQTNLTFKDGPGSYEESSPILDYDYDLETPLRAILSGALLMGKKGLLSLDYELVDYSSAKLRNGGDGETFFNENQDIAEAYKAVGNIRLGGEYRMNDNVSLRAGYQLYPSVYKKQAFDADQPNSDSDLSVYSAGIGFKQGGFSFDVAYRYHTFTEYSLPYPSPETNSYPSPSMAKFDMQHQQVMFTLGFRF
jgi:long-subunit fatty acid transport protein